MNPLAPFAWIAAIRFLREGRMQTLFIVVATAIGVAVIVFMSALLASLQANFLKRLLTASAHIQLLRPDETARALRPGAPGVLNGAIIQIPSQRVLSIDQWQKIVALVQATQGVTRATPVVTGSVLAVRGAASRSVTALGIEPDSYFQIVRIPDYIVAGTPRLGADDVIIGTELATDLGASLGDKINLASARGGSRTLTITGIFDLGARASNKSTIYVALRTAQALTGLVGGATSIEVTVADIYAADRIAAAIAAWSGLHAISWIESNAQFFTALNAQKQSNTLIRVFVGLSVAFGIASVLIVSVIQRARDIGILRAMGTSRRQVLLVFLLQGGILGFAGSLAGAAAGGGAVVFWHAILRQPDGSELFPLILEPPLFVGAVALAALTGVLAAAIPALRAARLDPVVAIRG